MQPEPLFQSFDAGWIPLAVAACALMAFGFAWIVDQFEPFPDLSDDPVEHETERERRSLEDDARRNPF